MGGFGVLGLRFRDVRFWGFRVLGVQGFKVQGFGFKGLTGGKQGIKNYTI